MTGAQSSYLKTLCEAAGEAFDPNLTKAAADALKGRMRRGAPHKGGGGRAGF